MSSDHDCHFVLSTTGTGKFNSYQGCERCVCDGANVSGSVRFICMCAKKRREEEWDDYLIPTETSAEACGKNPEKKHWTPVKHRTGDTPFNEMPRPFNMVSITTFDVFCV